MPQPVRTVSLRIPGLQGASRRAAALPAQGLLGSWPFHRYFHCGRKYALGDLGETRCIIHFLECFLTLLPSGHPETCLLNVNGAFY